MAGVYRVGESGGWHVLEVKEVVGGVRVEGWFVLRVVAMVVCV